MIGQICELIKQERNKIERQILELEKQLEHLNRIEGLVGTFPLMDQAKEITLNYPETGRRYTKGKRWTDIETRQIIDMAEKGFSVSKMASILKTNVKRIRNKIWNLKNEGRLRKNSIGPSFRTGVNHFDRQ